ncbi:unnamed protein product [Soboliphyme baturini]|uniref:Uncharacterized protein n=1 Tax=Soboliphyme baturini TaxID=241478 RepID=A0A183ISJ1_9BILA|nr:unnamed protein product [Soboliphyme baturini]
MTGKSGVGLKRSRAAVVGSASGTNALVQSVVSVDRTMGNGCFRREALFARFLSYFIDNNDRWTVHSDRETLGGPSRSESHEKQQLVEQSALRRVAAVSRCRLLDCGQFLTRFKSVIGACGKNMNAHLISWRNLRRIDFVCACSMRN